MKVTNNKITHAASVACGFTFSLGIIVGNIALTLPSILSGNYRMIYVLSLIIGILLFFSASYLICRFLLLFLYPIYLQVSNTLSVVIFSLVGAVVSILPLILMDAVYRSALDIPFSMEINSIVGHTLFGVFGSCCALSAWYVLRKNDPNKALQRISR